MTKEEKVIEEVEATPVTALAEVSDLPQELASPVLNKIMSAGYYSSIDNSTFDGKKKLSNLKTSSVALSKFMGTPIEVVDIVLTTGTHIDEETGEVRDVFVTYIVDENGQGYMSKSSGIANSAAIIIDDLGEPSTWPESVKVIVTETKTNKQRPFKQLAIV